jgi:hypothetical protein
VSESPQRPLGNQSRRTLSEGNPSVGFPSNGRFAPCHPSKEHLAMNSWEDAPWRGGRAGGYSRRPLEGDPAKGSSSKSARDPPPLGDFGGDTRTGKNHIFSKIAERGYSPVISSEHSTKYNGIGDAGRVAWFGGPPPPRAFDAANFPPKIQHDRPRGAPGVNRDRTRRAFRSTILGRKLVLLLSVYPSVKY